MTDRAFSKDEITGEIDLCAARARARAPALAA
jgi:hypothetical protein